MLIFRFLRSTVSYSFKWTYGDDTLSSLNIPWKLRSLTPFLWDRYTTKLKNNLSWITWSSKLTRSRGLGIISANLLRKQAFRAEIRCNVKFCKKGKQRQYCNYMMVVYHFIQMQLEIKWNSTFYVVPAKNFREQQHIGKVLFCPSEYSKRKFVLRSFKS